MSKEQPLIEKLPLPQTIDLCPIKSMEVDLIIYKLDREEQERIEKLKRKKSNGVRIVANTLAFDASYRGSSPLPRTKNKEK